MSPWSEIGSPHSLSHAELIDRFIDGIEAQAPETIFPCAQELSERPSSELCSPYPAQSFTSLVPVLYQGGVEDKARAPPDHARVLAGLCTLIPTTREQLAGSADCLLLPAG